MYFVSLIALLILGAFFAVSEISLAAAKRTRLQTLVEEGNKKAQQVLDLQDHAGHFVTVIQIGINAVALAGGILGERFFTPFFTEISARVSHPFRVSFSKWRACSGFPSFSR